MAQAEKGSIADYALGHVLEHLAESRATGMLEVRSPRGKKFILLEEGQIIIASEGEFRRELLGELLVAREKITRKDLEKALEVQAFRGQRLGEVLIESGLITKEDMEDILKYQIEEEICDLFSWKQGIYEFRPDAAIPKETANTAISLKANPKTLLIECAKRIRQWEEISSFITSPLAVYQLTPTGEKVLKTSAKGGRRVLTMIDEGLPIEEIVRHSFLGRFSVYKAVSDLIQTKAVVERNREDLENLAADRMRGQSYKTARFIYKRLLELSRAPIEIQRAREQLAYLDELERTESKVMAAKVPARVPAKGEVADTTAVTKMMPQTTTHKVKVIRRLRIEVVAILIVLLVTLGTVIAVFAVPALRERILDPGRVELGALINTVDNMVANAEYEPAHQALQSFMLRHPAGESRKVVEARLEELENKMDQAVQDGLLQASTLAMAESYRAAIECLDKLLENYPSSNLRLEIIKRQEQYKRQWEIYVERSSADDAVKKLDQSRRMYTDGRIQEATDILNDILSATKAPQTTKNDASMLLGEIKNLERVLDDLLSQGLSKEASGEFESALALYRQVANRAPESSTALKAREHIATIEETKDRLRKLLDGADAAIVAGNPQEAVTLLDQAARRKGYLEAERAHDRIMPIRDKLDRAKKVFSAYQEAVSRKDFPVAARLARTLFDEYAGYVDTSSVLFPVAVHSVPSGADVRADGKPVGTTPCTVLVPSNRRTPLRLTSEGFNPTDVVIDDPGKGVYRVYLERTPRKRIQIPGEIAFAKFHEKDRIVLILKGGEDQPQYRLGAVTLTDGYFRDMGFLGIDSVEADAEYRGTLYFAGSGRIAAVMPAEGKTTVVVGDAPADAKAVLLYVEQAPLLANKVIAGLIMSDGRSLGYKIDDGEKVWEARPVESVTSAAENKEYVLACGMGKVVCLDRISAKQRWDTNTGELLAGPVISPMGWFGYIDGRMMVIVGSPATGDLTSQAQLAGIRQLLPPVHLIAAENLLYLVSQEFFYALKPGKGVIADTALDRKVLADPVVSGKNIYLVGEGAMFRIQKDTVRPDWRYESRGSIVKAVVTESGLAVIENADGRGNILLFDE